jgi:rfaE bifunctional protein nucleotidyltransferase chain/domain
MSRIYTLEEVIQATNEAREKGLTIVATNGCFDIVHVGHVRNLYDAKSHGDVLVVGINSDSSVQVNKGPLRPIIPERERAEVIASLEPVDYVFIFDERTPDEWMKKVRPHIHVKAEDAIHHPDYPQQKKTLESLGGKFVHVKLQTGRSTSNIIQRIIDAYKGQ